VKRFLKSARAMASLALIASCGAPPAPVTSPVAVPSSTPVAAPSRAPEASAPAAPEGPALRMFMSTAMVKSGALFAEIAAMSGLAEFHSLARLSLHKSEDVDWIAVAGPSMDLREDVILVHHRFGDADMATIMESEGTATPLDPPFSRGWVLRGDKSARVFFREQPDVLAAVPRAQVADVRLRAVVDELARRADAPFFISVRADARGLKGPVSDTVRQFEIRARADDTTTHLDLTVDCVDAAVAADGAANMLRLAGEATIPAVRALVTGMTLRVAGARVFVSGSASNLDMYDLVRLVPNSRASKAVP
jgi:hypothetical protein